MLDALLKILLGTVVPKKGLAFCGIWVTLIPWVTRSPLRGLAHRLLILLMINVMKMKAIVTPIWIVLMAFFVEQIIALRDSQKDSTAAQQILLVVIVMLVRIDNSIYLKFLKYLLSIFYLIKLKENSE